MKNHDTFMKRALALAERGRGFTSPNPVVGACVVKNQKIISEGFHQFYGGAHAELGALKKAGTRARGATLYVTLEPCSSWGKTPPCVQSIIRSGIKTVVIAAPDPNPKHNGNGIRILKKAGIRVKTGVLREEAESQTRAFRKWILKRKPYVILKLAQSIDGKIATHTGDSKWISSEAARTFAHRLRSQVDAVLVGKNTVLRDNPKLTVRSLTPTPLPQAGEGIKIKKGSPLPQGEGRVRGFQPWKIVLDTKAEISKSAAIFRNDSTAILVCADSHLKQAVKKFSKNSVSILPVSMNGHQRLNLNSVLEKLGKLGVTSILVEGGGEVAASFLEQKLADEIYFVIAPKIIGGRNAKTSIEGSGISKIGQAVRLRNQKMQQIGEDMVISGELS